ALAAVAVGDAILALTGEQSRIKWPNDLLVRGKKVCGILIESSTTTAIGIGINLNQTAAEFAAAGLTEAGSLGEIAERPIPVWSAAENVIQKLDLEFARLLRGEIIALEAEWKWRVGLLGRQVALELNAGGEIAGRLRDMSFEGIELDCNSGGPRLIVPEAVRRIRVESL
ncbi:MAG TPA: hypothetical protein VLM40_15130, partial [Gemmata sp.]|nr:hypothetical protein [Gemmata sp.]